MSAHVPGTHTPGPWSFEHNECGHWDIVASSAVVAQVHYVDNAPCPIGEADARMIASAPALLAAAQIAFETLAPLKDDDFVWAAMSQLMNAIASATGEA